MNDITNPKINYLKGRLFLVLGGLASGPLPAQLPKVRSVLLLTIAIWAFYRAYYFA